MALQVALVGTLASRVENLLPVVLQCSWDVQRAFLIALLASYACCVIATVAMGAKVYIPLNPRTGKSLIFFEDVAALSFESFQRQANQLTPAEIESQLLDQVHRVSQIASVKMRWVRWAFWVTVPSLILWLALIVWGAI